METPIVRLKADKVTGSLYGYGFLEFTSPQNATTALENLNGAMIRTFFRIPRPRLYIFG